VAFAGGWGEILEPLDLSSAQRDAIGCGVFLNAGGRAWCREMLAHTSTDWAPWHVIPADHKWFARLAAASVLMGTLMRIDPQIPEVDAEAREALDAARAELETQAPRDEPADPVAEDPDEYR
jgi:hypothetical protein